MDKGKLVSFVRLKTGWDKDVSEQAVRVVMDCVKELLIHHGSRLTVHGFGSFIVRITKPRRARNIRTGEAVAVPPRKQVKFRMSPDFFD